MSTVVLIGISIELQVMLLLFLLLLPISSLLQESTLDVSQAFLTNELATLIQYKACLPSASHNRRVE